MGAEFFTQKMYVGFMLIPVGMFDLFPNYCIGLFPHYSSEYLFTSSVLFLTIFVIKRCWKGVPRL